MTAQNDLVERIRDVLRDRNLREVPMFGGVSFMVWGRLILSALRDGGLLVHTSTERATELRTRPGARRARMGSGREMGPGWIRVDVGVLVDDDALAFWIGEAITYLRA